MPEEQCKDLVRIHEGAVAVDGADAVAVSIGTQSRVEFSSEHRLPQGVDVRFDRFRMHAAESRIARAANLVAGDAIAAQQLGQQARGRSMHGIRDEAESRVAKLFPVHQFFEFVEIRLTGFQRLNEIFLRWQRGNVRTLHDFEIAFNLRHDGRQSRAAVARFVLDAIPWIGIVASGDHQAAGRSALPHEQGNCRSGAGLVGQENGRTGGRNHVGRDRGDFIRGESMVIADDDAFARILATHDVAGNGLRHNTRIRESKIFRDDAPPAIGAELNGVHICRCKVYARRTIRQQPDWPVTGGLSAAALRAISRFCQRPGRVRAGRWQNREMARRAAAERPPVTGQSGCWRIVRLAYTLHRHIWTPLSSAPMAGGASSRKILLSRMRVLWRNPLPATSCVARMRAKASSSAMTIDSPRMKSPRSRPTWFLPPVRPFS